MKVKVLSRDPSDYLKTRSGDLPKLPRNADPVLHPHSAQREYTAALNAVKLERVFAKPFVGSLEGIVTVFSFQTFNYLFSSVFFYEKFNAFLSNHTARKN